MNSVHTPAAMPGRSAPAAKTPRPARPAGRMGAWELPVLGVAVTLLLARAWIRRNEGDISAETGVGYALGIAGGLMMLVLLVYPLRKRLKSMRHLGNVPGWFRIHMILGIMGPTLILLHSNFTFGSLNSTAAMASMLVVAGSGILGRFFYSRIHQGLYGQKQSLQDLLSEVETVKARLAGDPATGAAIAAELAAYQVRRVGHVGSFWTSLARAWTGPFSSAMFRQRLLAELKDAKRDRPMSAADRQHFTTTLDRYLHALGRAEAFTLYERLFAAWHLLHMPLFVILVLAAFAHVVAVHLY